MKSGRPSWPAILPWILLKKEKWGLSKDLPQRWKSQLTLLPHWKADSGPEVSNWRFIIESYYTVVVYGNCFIVTYKEYFLFPDYIQLMISV